jgi:hypothetical protein
MDKQADFLIIASGNSGLMVALKVAEVSSVPINRPRQQHQPGPWIKTLAAGAYHRLIGSVICRMMYETVSGGHIFRRPCTAQGRAKPL